MKKHFFAGLISGLLIVALCTAAVLASTGSESDPLISKSYLETVFLNTVKNETSFKLVELTKGQKIVCGEGCELILRMGDATIFATKLGGLSDVTAGIDLPNGTAMPLNHHLIVPVGDGRGITSHADALLVLVKGNYVIK